MQRAIEPAGRLSLAFVRVLGDGILQLLLVTFIVFFYYRDGDRIVAILRRVSERLSGRLSAEVLTIVTGTTRSVFIGIVGTAAAQALVALIGFLIAGVPGAFMLAVATFVLSVVPMGPVLIWGAAAIWLYVQGETGWTIFMVIWGAVVISSIDNFLKPILIARGSTLSLGHDLSRRARRRHRVRLHRRDPRPGAAGARFRARARLGQLAGCARRQRWPRRQRRRRPPQCRRDSDEDRGARASCARRSQCVR